MWRLMWPLDPPFLAVFTKATSQIVASIRALASIGAVYHSRCTGS